VNPLIRISYHGSFEKVLTFCRLAIEETPDDEVSVEEEAVIFSE